jgi:hypothetical protein
MSVAIIFFSVNFIAATPTFRDMEEQYAQNIIKSFIISKGK